ncbi:sodium channel and clathrin linker 1-like [Oncorhynchus keta]|uniref:sodium channel and clathrin linker 1-like n=2 Tax=Oncorhynchus keta TaxID=8018 RepID=UPI00227AA6D6|nr:sodium channel and clathrin linker 1-like [Oncorhynchus keta]
MVSKPDGSLRFCNDFRKVNEISKFDAYPVLRVDELLEKIGNARYITTLDLTKGYWQIPLTPRAKENTAFATPDGLFQYTVMPFGLHGAPATFQRLMDKVLKPHKAYAAAYLDDVGIYSPDWESHGTGSDDAAEAHGREEASDRRLHHLQSALSQLEARLKAATQEAEGVRREQVVWERQVGELQVRCASLEEERYEAFSKVRDSIQLAEEASLQKDQALLREKQKSEELDRMNEAVRQLIQDAAIRTRKEVENVRKQCNSQIHRMAEELSALQLECADKESQMERSMREMRAVEEELEKVYKEGRGEPEYRKIEVLHQRSLNAERLKDDMNITLQSTHNKMKKLEMDYSEELSRCQEEVRRLQGSLSAAREDCSGVSEERLQLQQENMQLRREMEELRKASMMTQRRAKQQVSQMEQEYSLKEQGLEARVREMEESSRSSSADLTRLLSAQQKTSQRWKEEAKTLTLTFQTKLTSLKGELSRQRQRCQELEIQLVTDHETIVEYERQMAEYQEKNSRLQRRLTQAEQKATTASQQLSIMTSQRRKTSSMADLESL